MADVKKINGYNVKDEVARQQIANLPISKIQHGSYNFTQSSLQQDEYVELPTAYSDANYVVVATVFSPQGNYGDQCIIKNKTKTGFTITTSASVSTAHASNIDWITISS